MRKRVGWWGKDAAARHSDLFSGSRVGPCFCNLICTADLHWPVVGFEEADMPVGFTVNRLRGRPSTLLITGKGPSQKPNSRTYKPMDQTVSGLIVLTVGSK